jgi:hypothetical protein
MIYLAHCLSHATALDGMRRIYVDVGFTDVMNYA